MTPFRKSLRLYAKAQKHAWNHIGFGSKRPEAIDYYTHESIDARIKKSVHKDNRGQRVFACQ